VEELPTSSDLSKSILEALQSSRFLIVVCSPRARSSRWIAKEIEIFQALGRSDRILTLLLDGEPADAFPPALIERRFHQVVAADGSTKDIEQLSEPLAADIRSDTLRHSRRLLKVESLRILATVLGCKFDDLRKRHQERARRRVWTAAGAIVALLLVVACLGLFALLQRQEAARQELMAAQARNRRPMRPCAQGAIRQANHAVRHSSSVQVAYFTLTYRLRRYGGSGVCRSAVV
jgi:hypothetical protein